MEVGIAVELAADVTKVWLARVPAGGWAGVAVGRAARVSVVWTTEAEAVLETWVSAEEASVATSQT